MRCLTALTTVALAACVVSTASAAVTPIGMRLQAKNFLTGAGASDLAFFPTRVPAHFVFDSFSVSGSPASLDLDFSNQHFVANPTQMREHEIVFETTYLVGKSCAGSTHSTLRVGGVTLHTDATSVWRCVTTSRGRVVKESAAGPASLAALAVLVAYARPS